MEWLFLLIGVLIGGLAAWFLGRAQARDSLGIVRQQIDQKDTEILRLRSLYDEEHGRRVAAEARLEESQKRLAEQKADLEKALLKMEDTFASLSQRALGSSSEIFLSHARAQLETLVTDAKGDLGKRQDAIDASIKPLVDLLKQYDQQVQQLGMSIQKDYGSVGQQLTALQKETGILSQALRAPKVRGRWGELTLRRVVELAGMTEYCDFDEQVTVGERNEQRPDLVVRLPDEKTIVIDAKVPLGAFQEMVEAGSEAERQSALRRHASQVRDNMKRLSDKAYWKQFKTTPDFVVMFIPGESFFSAAVEVDRGLIEEALASHVILSSPTTIMVLLRTVAEVWRQRKIQQNATAISELGKALSERLSVFQSHLSGVGANLRRAVVSYNQAIRSMESRVLVQARRFKELGASSVDFAEQELIDAEPLLPDGEVVEGGSDDGGPTGETRE